MHAAALVDINQAGVHLHHAPLQPMLNRPAYAPSATGHGTPFWYAPSRPEPIFAAAYGSSDAPHKSRTMTNVRVHRRPPPEQLGSMRDSPLHAKHAYFSMPVDTRVAARQWLVEVGARLLSKQRLMELPSPPWQRWNRPKVVLADPILHEWMQMVFEARKLEINSWDTLNKFVELKLEPDISLSSIQSKVNHNFERNTSRRTATNDACGHHQGGLQSPFDVNAPQLLSRFVIGDLKVLPFTQSKVDFKSARILGMITVEGKEYCIYFGILNLNVDARLLLPRWAEFRDEWRVEGALGERNLEPTLAERMDEDQLQQSLRQQRKW
ncbi:hypothetical protein ACQY0O_007868 [Thecaphora frezii]